MRQRPKQFPSVDEIIATWTEVSVEQAADLFNDEPNMGLEETPQGFYARFEDGHVGEYDSLLEAVYVLDGKISSHYDFDNEKWRRYHEPVPGAQEACQKIDAILEQVNSLLRTAHELARTHRLEFSVEGEVTQWNVDEDGDSWVSSRRCW